MANDREALTRQIKEASDIVDVVGGYVTLHSAGGKFKGLCPFHDDHRPSFIVDPQWQNYRCWACGKSGDVFTFIQEKERVDFREARELLARRANISLEKTADSPHSQGRALMLDVMRWADEQYQRCLHETPLAETARRYLDERHLSAETVRRFGLGFSPAAGDWLIRQAAKAQVALDVLEKVGLIAPRDEGTGHYGRFRDRIMFPIRNTRGQTVGFGGRILPSSPFSEKAPKYYNSSDTPLFSKSEQLYGIDLARPSGAAAGYLAVVEGYTDVMMAHQHGIGQVVATLGTALNARHVQQLRRFAPRVVLVFDADAGGKGGVDRALELFVSQEMDLAIATLPEGLDPCDLLGQQGPGPFVQALAEAISPLDFKLNQVLASAEFASIEGKLRAIDAVLGIIALTPEMPDRDVQLKQELVVNRIGQRLAVREEVLWARLKDMQAKKRGTPPRRMEDSAAPAERRAKAAPHERDLLQILLAEPALVPAAAAEIAPAEIEHPDVRKLVEELYSLNREGKTPDIEDLRDRIDHELMSRVLRARDIGRTLPNRAAGLQELLEEFRKRRQRPVKEELHNQLHAVEDHATAIALLRQLQQDQGNVKI